MSTKEQPYLPQQIPTKAKPHRNTNWVDTFTFGIIAVVVAIFIAWLMIDNYEIRNSVDTRSKGWTTLCLIFVIVVFIFALREAKIHELDWIGGFDMLRIDFYYFDPDFYELTNDEQVMEKVDPLLREQEKWWPVEYILDVKQNKEVVREFLYNSMLEKTASKILLTDNPEKTHENIEKALNDLYKVPYDHTMPLTKEPPEQLPEEKDPEELSEKELAERMLKISDDTKEKIRTEAGKELAKILEEQESGEDEYYFGYARLGRAIKWKIKRGKTETVHTSREALLRMPRPVRETFLWSKEYVTSGGFSLKHSHAEKVNLVFKETVLVDLPRFDVNDCGYYRKVKKLVKVDDDSKSARGIVDTVTYIYTREMAKIASDLLALSKSKSQSDEDADKALEDDMNGLTHESLAPMIRDIIKARMHPKKEELAVYWAFTLIFLGLFLVFMFLWILKIYPA